jgi:tetratricopeptide (TPR) repeat protein
LTTLAVHSFVDFNMHIPAVAVLAVVVAAVISGQRDIGRAEEVWTVRAKGVAPLMAAAAVLLIATVLGFGHWHADQVERFRLAALHCASSDDPATQARAVTYRRAAAALAPGNAERQLDLADILYERYQTALAAKLPPAQAEQQFLWPALRQYAVTRDVCPLLDRPHLRLAAHASRMSRADSVSDYLTRARRLLPSDDRVWYLCGVQALREGRHEDAWDDFHHSLTLSDRHLSAILAESLPVCGPKTTAERVLPENPALVVRAAEITLEGPQGQAISQVLFARAADLFERHGGELSTPDLHALARSRRAVGASDQALKAYEQLLDREPRQTAWRYEYCELLSEKGRLQEALRELATLLTDEPGHSDARQLRSQVSRRLAEGQ